MLVGLSAGDLSESFRGETSPETLDVSARFAIPISGRLMWRCFPANATMRLARNRALASYIERFNCTVRQRVSRLVRKTLSFSKKLENNIGAILLFVHHYNASLPL